MAGIKFFIKLQICLAEKVSGFVTQTVVEKGELSSFLYSLCTTDSPVARIIDDGAALLCTFEFDLVPEVQL